MQRTDGDVSVVLTVRRNRLSLPYLLRPLLADPATLEVLVVEDERGRWPPGCADPLDAKRHLDGENERHSTVCDERVRPVSVDAGAGPRRAGLAAARGELVLFLEDDVLARRGVVSGHAARQAGRDACVVVGYTPPRLLEGRVGADFAAHIYAREYEQRCGRFERDPSSVFEELDAVNVSLRRDDALAIGVPEVAAADRYRPQREAGLRLRDAGMSALYDRALMALRLHRQSVREFAIEARRSGGDAPDQSAWRRPLYAAGAAALRGVVEAAGSAHVWRLQDRSALLLRDLESALGA